ncbi:helix-turn-helix domain-containing protein [Cuniculiplasma divulgatum]|jgi:predicted DNA binding protein|uniref:Predicted transcriptional regulator with C-terminal HTH-like domain n=1 Tax=Cuniculiplasma divulgatum TaxID=1673428 RepID=A0A1N5W0C6_9ARCH|nr:helix-turn-helix domain-containing protein [Cuniculiplasma divulgatum]MCI2412180.1 helix-turn-helix domain-containing protein [Cuniculiplasma sp.]SIM78200.1 predicted transcriptional regulator with C-terminal HTH-like domain [Cuniculiplasma divulgatum]SJK85360.1 predicted transcriptional regulator with C-terminal HTH-like domain [Cuniculiplasma divulgatum]
MRQIDLVIDNHLAFNQLSKDFANIKFLRWCNSNIDYLEFYGKNNDLKALEDEFANIEQKLGTTIVYRENKEGKVELMMKCRCSIQNSSIRIAESLYSLWKGPVVYDNGLETITLIVIETGTIEKLIQAFEKYGEVKIKKSKSIHPETLRSVSTVSVSDIFSDLTVKQAKIMQIALANGYFKIPKATEIESLARIVSLSESTVEEHLNKAKNRILNNISPFLELFFLSEQE